MKKIILIAVSILSTQVSALSPWLETLDKENKQQQLDLRWSAFGGQADVKFMYNKLNDMHVTVSPLPQYPNMHWDLNHLVYPISENSKLELQMPYGNIEEVTGGSLAIDSDFTFTNGKYSIKVNSFKLIPAEKPKESSDIVNFKLIDQNNNHLFTVNSIHIEYDREQGLLLMSNMDLFATKEFATLLGNSFLEGQVVGQLHTYNKLSIPENAEVELRGGSCANHPVWPPAGNVDVALTAIGSVQYRSAHNSNGLDSDYIVIAPSASLKNVGTADVPWYTKYSGIFDPYNNDQHPLLNWAIYREVDGRFEQMAVSGVKHAFLTINFNCTIDCGNSHILWLGCEDVYGVGNNDSSSAIGPREEIEAYSGTWDNCGTFFDPMPCQGSQQNFSSGPGQFRAVVNTNDLVDANNSGVYMQAWYLIRDDVNIFNSMGYREITPTAGGGGWSFNPGPFANGAALDNYVPKNTISAMQSSQTIESREGQFAVAVKVIDLGNGLFRYNYAVENYEVDPQFSQFRIPMLDSPLVTDFVFSDPDDNVTNDWSFNLINNELQVTGSATNEQDWGMLFSFSFTAPSPPVEGVMTIDIANPNATNTVSSVVLVPDLNDFDSLFNNSFE